MRYEIFLNVVLDIQTVCDRPYGRMYSSFSMAMYKYRCGLWCIEGCGVSSTVHVAECEKVVRCEVLQSFIGCEYMPGMACEGIVVCVVGKN